MTDKKRDQQGDLTSYMSGSWNLGQGQNSAPWYVTLAAGRFYRHQGPLVPSEISSLMQYSHCDSARSSKKIQMVR
jgi:hypothetical protein